MAASIQAMGLSSALGPLLPACAAFRAGLARVGPSPELAYQPAEGLERVPVAASALPVSTAGFSGVGRLVAVLHEALVDLRARCEPPPGPTCAVFLAVPDPLDLGIPMQPELEEDPERRVQALGARMLARAADAAGLTLGAPRAWGGRTGAARALAAALAHMEADRTATALVAAVDSLLDPAALERLLLEERVKTDGQPTGLVPGEAGAALLLRPPARGGVATLQAVSVAEGPDRTPGRLLAGCVGELAGPAGEGAPALLVSDHNGEYARAEEWGGALHHLRGLGPRWASPPAWFPATGFGDVGAAAGALGVCLAARGLQRGYAPASQLLVLSSTEEEKAAVLVTAA